MAQPRNPEKYTGFAPESGGETVEVPAYYARELREREKIARSCPIKVFTATVNPRWGWPYGLNNSGEARPSTRMACDELIIDPGLKNVACSPEIARAAAKTDADYVIARDISPEHPAYGERDDRNLRSIETAVNFLALQREATDGDPCQVGKWDLQNSAKPIFPIQAPYDESLEKMQEEFRRDYYTADGSRERYTICPMDVVDYVAVGGLLSLDTIRDRIEALEIVRDTVGDDVKIHALAPGTDLKMLHALRENPDLVDSLDVSTPENAISNNKLPDKTWTQRPHPVPTGDDISTVRAAYATSTALQLAFMLNPELCDDEVFESGFSYQECLPTVETSEAIMEIVK